MLKRTVAKFINYKDYKNRDFYKTQCILLFLTAEYTSAYCVNASSIAHKYLFILQL